MGELEDGGGRPHVCVPVSKICTAQNMYSEGLFVHTGGGRAVTDDQPVKFSKIKYQ